MTHGFDVVVVGAGAGGAAAAYRLVQSGARVLLLEAGPRFSAFEDYPLTNGDWERHIFPEKPGSQATVEFGDLGKLDPAFADLKTWETHQRNVQPEVGQARPANTAKYSHVQGVGGTTLHFVGEAHRLHPQSLARPMAKPEVGGWPVSYAELEPYYSTCEHTIGVACDRPDAHRWRSEPYPMDAHPISPGGSELMAAGKRISRPWEVNPRAVNSAFYDDRPACNYCGQCSRGCPLGDKGSADVTFIRKALETGRLTLIANAPVLALKQSKTGEIESVQYKHNGEQKTVETPVLMLAAGAVQTPRLLLLSADTSQPEGIANGSGQVGKNFMETLWWSSSGTVPGLKNSHMGLPAEVTDWSRTAPGSVPGVKGGFKLSHTTLDIGLNGPIGFAKRMVGGFGRGFKQRLRDSFGSALSVTAIGQTVVDERSYIALSASQRDHLGLPVAQINSVLTENSFQLLRAMANACREVLGAANTQILEERSSYDQFVSTHVFGTARMGRDPAHSVVDAFGRSHDHPNLFICDASVFPTTGGGEAPALTIMALATRAAEHALK
ncbi:MAG: GMC family oxidoreductase [Pseudomonadota bacterium]|nr:GMC family oxidoreductase [Pseudomonadota bacterium]